MPHQAMAAYLLELHAHRGPGLPPLPLAACARELGLDGLALLLTAQGKTPELVQSHGPLTGVLEDLQLTQGQGPSWDAARTGALLLLPDLADPTGFAARRWPGLPGAVHDLGIAAVFALPLRLGAITLGALTGHRTRAGPLTPDELADALHLADTLTQVIITLTARPAPSSGMLLDNADLHFAEVHQATGMLAAQHGLTCAQALVHLRAYAFTQNRRLLSCARDVLDHRLRLDALDDTESDG
ncbi:ANTAR domain-containing protein [Streptomyces violascens]|uniref:ANTAR domain-containing protein n=1 Tax=Streptomyces violascens TaxID=67381 RepID=UPI0037AC4C1B